MKIICSQFIDKILFVFLGFLAIWLISELAISISWRIERNTPSDHNIAFLIDNYGIIPYKDIFDTNMLGTYFFHLTIEKVFGYGDLAFYIFDMIFLSILLIITWFIVKPFEKLRRLSSVLVFGLIYSSFGPSFSLQREFIAFIIITAVVVLITSNSSSNYPNVTAILIGALFGFSALI